MQRREEKNLFIKNLKRNMVNAYNDPCVPRKASLFVLVQVSE